MRKPSKPTKSPAPATRSAAKSAAKPAVVKTKTKAKTKTTATPSAKAAPAVTLITARVDVGFGNHLTLRGEGAGLNLKEGLRLENIGSDHWQVSLPGTAGPIRFKFLLNDELWCEGEDFVAVAGGLATFTPTF